MPPRRDFPGGDGSGGPEPDPEGRSGPHVAVFGIWLSLVPVLMLFAALIVTYVARKGYGTQWESFPVPEVLWLNTLFLLMSSIALEWSRRRTGDAVRAPRGFQVAFGMGLLFLVGQVVAWSEYIMRGVVVSTSPHSGFFYVLTAAHAAHVIGGLVGLWFLAVWQRHQWKFTTVPVLSRVTAVYWHFLGILWLTMFLMLKFWR